MEVVSENLAFGGVQGVYTHDSAACGGQMTFGLYLPPAAAKGEKVPALWYLSGLTCTHENAMVKAGAQAHAARHGIALVFPDTSPRGADVADDDAYDLGQGAGFYVDATEAPWAPHFSMYSYVSKELPALIDAEFPTDSDRWAISGHSMGGHGALTVGMKNPERFKSISAFSPIVAPLQCPWGEKAIETQSGIEKTLMLTLLVIPNCNIKYWHYPDLYQTIL